jgi:hypothetical protein
MRTHRAITLLTVTVLTATIAWLTWPGHTLHNRTTHGPLAFLSSSLPAVTIHVTTGGRATLTTDRGTIALPETIRVEGGTPAVIRFENADTIPQRLGFFSVPANSQREYTITHPGTYSGYCSAHPAKRLTYIVEQP